MNTMVVESRAEGHTGQYADFPAPVQAGVSIKILYSYMHPPMDFSGFQTQLQSGNFLLKGHSGSAGAGIVRQQRFWLGIAI
jgi:hypothetical protein